MSTLARPVIWLISWILEFSYLQGDVNRVYLACGDLWVEIFGRGAAWLDAGTEDSLLEVANFVAGIERRQRLEICCPEEIAWQMDYIDSDALARLAMPLNASGYGRYLLSLLKMSPREAS